MSMVAGGISAGVGAAASVGGGLLGKGAAKKARKRAQAGYDKAKDLTNEGFPLAAEALDSSNTAAIEGLDTYADIGEGALGKLAYGLGFDVAGMEGKGLDKGSLLENFSADKFKTDPGYEFARSEGNRGIERGASARGSLLSGSTLKALNKFNTGLANQQYGDAYERYNKDRTFQAEALTGVGRMGQTAATDQGKFWQNYGGKKTQLITDKYDKLAGLALGRAGVGAQAALQKGKYAQDSVAGVGGALQSFTGSFFS